MNQKYLKQLENKVLSLDVNSPNLVVRLKELQDEIIYARKARLLQDQFKVIDLYVRGEK